jgi:hypothetical protein
VIQAQNRREMISFTGFPEVRSDDDFPDNRDFVCRFPEVERKIKKFPAGVAWVLPSSLL